MTNTEILQRVRERVFERTGLQAALLPGERVDYVLRWDDGDRSVSLAILGGLFMLKRDNGAFGVAFSGEQKAAAAPGVVVEVAEIVASALKG